MKRTIFILLILSITIYSQGYDFSNSLSFKNNSSFFQVKDIMKKLNFRQSYSVAYSSSTYGSGMSGMYLNNISYQFEKPIEINVVWGFMNSFSGNTSFDSNQPQFMLPQFSVKFKPFKNMIIQFEYRKIPYN